MIPKEVLKELRRIQIITSRLVRDVFCGQYQSIFKGRGIEFSEVREYQRGDDIRSIDWNVTARTGRLHIKKYNEERELSVFLILDLSPSLYFGTVNKIKRQLAAEIFSLLAFSALRNNDKVGLLVFTDRIEKFIPPRKGLRHVLHIIRDTLYFEPQGKGTEIASALEYFNKACRRRGIVFLLSDFYAPQLENILNITRRHHDLVAITITDPKEISLPNLGLISLRDIETGQHFILDTSTLSARYEFQQNSLKILEERKQVFRRLDIDHIDIYTDRPYAEVFFKFFRMRAKRIALHLKRR